MLYQRKGEPLEGEILLCTITKIYHHSVFANLDEYPGKSGMIHISEIAPGRIRNIRDYVVEGKKVICKILKIDPEKGHIDLSLRRVNESQKRAKNDFIKQEQKAEKIVEFASKEFKKDLKKVYTQIAEKTLTKFESLHDAFYSFVLGSYDIAELGFDKDFTEKLAEIIRQRVKPPEVELTGKLSIVSYAPNGIDVVKQSLQKAEEIAEGEADIRYLGAGKFMISVKSADFKEAESILDGVVKAATDYALKNGAQVEFTRAKAKS